METVAAGGDVPRALKTEACRFKFAPAVERTIEAPHALVNAKVGHKKVSAPYISLATRMPLLDELLRARGENAMEALAACYSVAQDTDELAKRLFLYEHPDFPKRGEGWSRHKCQVLSSIVYRQDLVARFQSRSAAKRVHVRAVNKEKREAAQVLMRLHGIARPTHAHLNDVMSQLALEHIRAVSSSGLK